MYFIGSIVIYPLWIYNELGTLKDLGMSLYLVIPAILGQFFGTKLRARIPNDLFRNTVLTVLLIMGISLLVKNF